MITRFSCFSDQNGEVTLTVERLWVPDRVVRVSQKLLISWDFHATVSRVCKEWCDKQNASSEQQLCGNETLIKERGPRRRARLVKADRKATVTQITAHRDSGMQKSVSDYATRQTPLADMLQQQKANTSQK